jgi:quercetin dioxygenase-like cupin family protein
MKKLAITTVGMSLLAGAFLAGVAVGKDAAPKAKFIAAEEVKWDDVGGPKLGTLTGDYKKGPYVALMKLPAGFTSPEHTHSSTYEAVEISGTSSHWLKGEDGTKAKKMTPGSYWTITGKAEHISSCAPGADCVFVVWQKSKFDVALGKDEAAKMAAGSAATKADPKAAGSGVTKVDAKAAQGAGAGSAGAKTEVKAGAGMGSGTGSAAKK